MGNGSLRAGLNARARLQSPLQRFLRAETAGGVVLVVAAIAALAWVNSPWGGGYEDFWRTSLTADLRVTRIRLDARHVISDGAMTLFFFVVSLEIKRELVRGELASRRSAALPVAAALGGMLVPAGVFLALNAGGEGERGWGIPMATDIAFAAGVLALAGSRVPVSLKVFLLALAIVDDLGAILVIAVFYAEDVAFQPLAWGALLCAGMVAARLAGMRSPLFYMLPGLLLWFAVYESGIHATIAGVVLAALTPAGAGEGGEAPLDGLERALHPWASMLVAPAFALANSGIDLSPGFLGDVAGSQVSLGVVIGLLAGKPLGIVGAALLAVRLGLAAPPAGATWRALAAVGMLGGIGFTVSLFVTELAFTSASIAAEAKAGVFVASIAAAVLGLAALRTGSRGTRASAYGVVTDTTAE